MKKEDIYVILYVLFMLSLAIGGALLITWILFKGAEQMIIDVVQDQLTK